MATRAQRLTVEALDAYDDARVELVNGELVRDAMTSFEHGDAQASISGELKPVFRGNGPPGGEGWWIATEVHVVYAPDQCFRHDVTGWRKSRVTARPVGKRVTTRPDWVCEILSTNRSNDLHTKRRVLHAAGVPHYWIVDLDVPLLTVLRHSHDGYLIAMTSQPGDRVRIEPFDAIEIDVMRLFGDVGEPP